MPPVRTPDAFPDTFNGGIEAGGSAGAKDFRSLGGTSGSAPPFTLPQALMGHRQPVQVASTSMSSVDGYGAGTGSRLLHVTNPRPTPDSKPGQMKISARQASDTLAEAYGLTTPAQKEAFAKLGLFPEKEPVQVVPLVQDVYMPLTIPPELHDQLQSIANNIKTGQAQQQQAAAARAQHATQVATQTRQALETGRFYADPKQLSSDLKKAGVGQPEVDRLVRLNNQKVTEYLTNLRGAHATDRFVDGLQKLMPGLVKSGYVTQKQAQQLLDKNWLNWARSAVLSGDAKAPSRAEVNNKGHEIIARYSGKTKEAFKQQVEEIKAQIQQRSARPAPAPVASTPVARTPPVPAPVARTPPTPAPVARTSPAPAPVAHTPPAPALAAPAYDANEVGLPRVGEQPGPALNRPEQVVAERLKVGPDGKPLLPLEARGDLDVSRLEAPRNASSLAPSDTDRTPPSEQSIPERIFNFFKGFGLEGVNTVLALGDLARLLNDANPLTQPGNMLRELIMSPFTGKSPGEVVNERGEKFIKANKVLLDQVVAVLKLAADLSTPMQMTNAMKMANDMARDVQGLLNRNELTAGAVAQVIVARTGQNPSLQAAATVVDSLTNYKKVLETGGDPEEIGRAAFRIFASLVDFAKPAAAGKTSIFAEQGFVMKPLQQMDLLSQLSAPGKSVVVKRANMSLENLAQLTKEMNREFALLTKGDERMLIAGDAVSVPLTPDQMRQLSEQGWKLTAHSHLSGLTPSVGDGRVLAASGQKRSIIVEVDTTEMGRISYTPEQGSGGRTDRISTGGLTPAQLDEAVNTLRAGGAIKYIDPIFQDIRANGLGTPGQYNLEGATTMRDGARRNTSLHAAGATLDATPHDLTHATMAGAGGHINNTGYLDGTNGLLGVADNFTMKDFMEKFGGDVTKVDWDRYIQENYINSALSTERLKFLWVLQNMDNTMVAQLPSARGNPVLMRNAFDQFVHGTQALLHTSDEYGILNPVNYMYEGIPGPGGAKTNIKTVRSEAVRTAVDAAWDNIINGYKTDNRALVEKGLEELKDLQLREMIFNTVPKEQAVMALKDHITYHELFAEQYVAKYPGKTKADYYVLLGDKNNIGNELLNLKVPSRQAFDRKRRELFPNG